MSRGDTGRVQKATCAWGRTDGGKHIGAVGHVARATARAIDHQGVERGSEALTGARHAIGACEKQQVGAAARKHGGRTQAQTAEPTRDHEATASGLVVVSAVAARAVVARAVVARAASRAESREEEMVVATAVEAKAAAREVAVREAAKAVVVTAAKKAAVATTVAAASTSPPMEEIEATTKVRV